MPPNQADIENSTYNFQTELTKKLDGFNSDFDQATINEIVLWKVNRYVSIDTETIELLNKIKKSDTELNSELT